MSNFFETSFLSNLSSQDGLVLGVDEVGRGALFGPVVASAVALPFFLISDLIALGVKDSKELSVKKRELIAGKIKDFVPYWAIASATVQEIDQLNILQASLLAMKRAILELKITPELCLIDGNQTIPNLGLPQIPIVKGDSQSSLIGSASILAKVWRDELIVSLAKKYPKYDLASNKGYGTKKHILAIQKHGLTPEHRRSFSISQQLSLV